MRKVSLMDKVIDKGSNFHFTIIDNYILENANLSGIEQIAYVHLKKYSSQVNKCFPGINSLADSMKCSANTVRKVLKSLKEKGFIDVKQRFNESNEYTLLPYPKFEKSKEDNNIGPVNKFNDVIKVYQNNINQVYGAMEREKLITWFDTFEENEEVLIKAIEIAVSQGVRKLKYIESILINWHQQGIKTLEQCEAYQKQWDERKGKSNGSSCSREDNTETTNDRYDFSKYGEI